jgi:hypothetical protein
MTDEQLKAIASGVIDLGDAIRNIGLALWPIPPMPPPIDPPPVDPPPVEPPTESEFMRAVVLREDFEPDHVGDYGGRFHPRADDWYTFGNLPAYNVTGKSWGLSFKLFNHSPPTGTSPLSLWDDSSPQWQMKCPGPTRLAVAFALTGGSYDGFDEVVDDMTGRWVHVVIGYDYEGRFGRIWIDGVLRLTKGIPHGIGHSPNSTPPLIVNSTAAGHAPGDISIDELVYAVGAAPTQADVDALSGIVPKPPGFSNGVTDGTIWAEANGEEFAALALHDPMAWIDGRNVTMKQTVNNPPLRKRYEAPIPQDIGRVVE